MNVQSILLVSSVWGFISVLFLFLFCFFCVHVVKLAKIGRYYQKENAKKANASPPPQPTQDNEKEKAQEKPSESNRGEPIYYIVERKKRTKSSFGPPKRIDFK